jgi:DNA invertase Pin-like site-specific DNA recombinase
MSLSQSISAANGQRPAIAAYIRLSRENEDSASIETQRAAVRRWAEANVFDPAEMVEYIDSGVSGAKALDARKGMRQLMAERPVVAVAWKLDRYARSVSEFLRLVAWGEAHGVRLATTDNTINTASPTGRMVAVVLAALAEWEREMIKGRIIDGHATRRAQGRWGAGQPPYGYAIERRDGAAYLVRNEPEAAKIREAVDALINGGTVTSTARMVDISEPQWRRMLKAPTLRGQRAHKGKLILAEDGITPIQFAEPILNAAEHKAVRDRLLALATGQDRAPRGESPQCAGMAWCYKCGGPLSGGKSGAGVRLYKCKLGHVTMYAETIDQRVEEAFLATWGEMAEYTVRLEGGNDLSDQMIEAQEAAERLASQMASAGPLMLTKLGEMAEQLEATYAALRASHDPDVREVLEPTGRTLGDAWRADTGSRGRLLRDVGLSITLYPKQRADRLEISWAIGGDDVMLAEYLGDLDASA